VTGRKQRKALARWEDETRLWAHETAKDLVMAMVTGQHRPVKPYRIGVVLEPGERVWSECPVRFLQERLTGQQVGQGWVPPVRPWLVTSERIVGRLGDDRLYGWRWRQVRGCRVEVSLPVERVSLDVDNASQVEWSGPGVALIAVAALYSLYGSVSLVDHPGLTVLRWREGEVMARLG
jgi:hypothetical protein